MCFTREPALATGLIHGSYDVEVSAATVYQAIFIGWTWYTGREPHELLARNRAPIHVVADNRHSRDSAGRFPTERNAVERGFMRARGTEAKQSAYRQQEQAGLDIIDCTSVLLPIAHRYQDSCTYLQLLQKVSS